MEPSLPRLLELEPLGVGPSSHIFTSPPGDFDARWGLRAAEPDHRYSRAAWSVSPESLLHVQIWGTFNYSRPRSRTRAIKSASVDVGPTHLSYFTSEVNTGLEVQAFRCLKLPREFSQATGTWSTTSSAKGNHKSDIPASGHWFQPQSSYLSYPEYTQLVLLGLIPNWSCWDGSFHEMDRNFSSWPPACFTIWPQ